ncbi:MAG: ectoine utilization protein EutC [Acidiferrobacterales bacterium]|nr:ectoine utilization protein EutC [Acidiferrobacterales bacterium]
MSKIRIVTESELRKVIRLDMDAVECMEGAFTALAEEGAVMPPILTMAIEESNGEVDVKTAYVPGLESFAIKISPGFFDNSKLGLPSTTGLMVLCSAQTGLVEAVFLDNGYLTDVRTAAAGAVAARYLSREDSAVACIVGAGQQAKFQLEALCLVRPIREAMIWGRDIKKVTPVAGKLSKKLGIAVQAVSDLENSVSSADIIVTATPSDSPLVMGEWLQKGQHVTSMGADQTSKNELHPQCLSVADLYVPDRRSQTERLGELHHAIVAGTADSESLFPELGEIVGGKVPGRLFPEAITICDLTGTGVQDTAIATQANRRVQQAGVGIMMET